MTQTSKDLNDGAGIFFFLVFYRCRLSNVSRLHPVLLWRIVNPRHARMSGAGEAHREDGCEFERVY